MTRCPHTMIKHDAGGATCCCDCGEELGRAQIRLASSHAALTQPPLDQQARGRCKRETSERDRIRAGEGERRSFGEYQATDFHSSAG